MDGIDLNCKKIGQSLGGYIPIRLNVTSELSYSGVNTLEVFVGDQSAIYEKSKYLNGPPEKLLFSAQKPASINAPDYCCHKGILQRVFL